MAKVLKLVKKPPIKTSLMIDPVVWHGAKIVSALRGINRSDFVNLALVSYFYNEITPEDRAELARIANGVALPFDMGKKKA